MKPAMPRLVLLTFLKEIIMTTHFAKSAVSTLVLAVAALGAASSIAGTSTARNTDGDLRFTPALTSTTTRAQVQAEYIQAAKSGQIVLSSDGTMLRAPAFVGTRSAAEVRAEAVYAAHHSTMGGSI